MKERPILFSTPMVQAILEGRKKMTRRVIKLQPWHGEYYDELAPSEYAYISSGGISGPYKCPYGKPGDILWVREKFRKYSFLDENGCTYFDKEIIEYAADNPELIPMVDGDGFHEYNKDGSEKFVPWKPSIHMPKEACRIRLLIKSILVERLQDISAEDIKAEGIYYTIDYYASLLQQWQDLWIKINGPESWEANPWVWVIKFEKL